MRGCCAAIRLTAVLRHRAWPWRHAWREMAQGPSGDGGGWYSIYIGICSYTRKQNCVRPPTFTYTIKHKTWTMLNQRGDSQTVYMKKTCGCNTNYKPKPYDVILKISWDITGILVWVSINACILSLLDSSINAHCQEHNHRNRKKHNVFLEQKP